MYKYKTPSGREVTVLTWKEYQLKKKWNQKKKLSLLEFNGVFQQI
jgi:hypothetical protein